MYQRFFLTIAALAALASSGGAQNFQRRATLTGGGRSDQGKCTIEVWVDGAAQVDIRGDNAMLRNLSGQQAQWRRFECTTPMPLNPADFRFAGVDGRGRQELVRDPRNGGMAVVRIEDPQGGGQGYTFDLTWSGGNVGNSGNYSGNYPGVNRNRGFRGNPQGVGNAQFAYSDAVRACQDAVRQQALERFRSANIVFRGSAPYDNQSRQDMMEGAFDVRGTNGRDDAFRYSCAMDQQNGRIQSVRIDPIDRGRDGFNSGSAALSNNAMQACQRAVEQRVGRDGYGRVEFGSMNPDNRSQRGDTFVGTARASRNNGSDTFEFSCTVDRQSGTVGSVDVIRR